jgi:hypothetical protein
VESQVSTPVQKNFVFFVFFVSFVRNLL